jgi:hypothetical protein
MTAPDPEQSTFACQSIGEADAFFSFRLFGRHREHKASSINYRTQKDLEAAGVGLDRVFKIGRFLKFGMKSIREKREIRSKGLVNPKSPPRI